MHSWILVPVEDIYAALFLASCAFLLIMASLYRVRQLEAWIKQHGA